MKKITVLMIILLVTLISTEIKAKDYHAKTSIVFDLPVLPIQRDTYNTFGGMISINRLIIKLDYMMEIGYVNLPSAKSININVGYAIPINDMFSVPVYIGYMGRIDERALNESITYDRIRFNTGFGILMNYEYVAVGLNYSTFNGISIQAGICF